MAQHPQGTGTARCLCGSVSYTALLKCRSPAQMTVCHCSVCRRHTGALSIPFAAFPRKSLAFTCTQGLKSMQVSVLPGSKNTTETANTNTKVEISAEGDVAANELVTELCSGNLANPDDTQLFCSSSNSSGAIAKRYFCCNCGAFIAMDYGEPRTVWMTIGLLSDCGDFQNYCKKTMKYHKSRQADVRENDNPAGSSASKQGLDRFRDSDLTTLNLWPGSDVFFESRCKLQDIFYSERWNHASEFGLAVIDGCDEDADGSRLFADSDKINQFLDSEEINS